MLGSDLVLLGVLVIMPQALEWKDYAMAQSRKNNEPSNKGREISCFTDSRLFKPRVKDMKQMKESITSLCFLCVSLCPRSINIRPNLGSTGAEPLQVQFTMSLEFLNV